MVSLRAITPKPRRIFNETTILRDTSRGMRQYLERVRDELRKGYDLVYENTDTYKRTDTLYNSFHISIDPGGQGGNLLNDARDPRGKFYAVYVIGPKGGGRGKGERQSELQRQRGWPSITDVARRNAPYFHDVMNRAISPSKGDVQRFG